MWVHRRDGSFNWWKVVQLLSCLLWVVDSPSCIEYRLASIWLSFCLQSWMIETHWFSYDLLIYSLVCLTEVGCVRRDPTLDVLSLRRHLAAYVVFLIKSWVTIEVLLSCDTTCQHRFAWILPCVCMWIILKLIKMVLLERCLLLRTNLCLRWLFIQTHLRTVYFRAESFCSIWYAWSVPSHIMMLWAPSRWRLAHPPILTVRILVSFNSPQIWIGIIIAFLRPIFIGIQSSLTPLISIVNLINLGTWPLLQVVPRMILQELLVVLLLILTLLLAILMLRQRILLACGARHADSFELGGQDCWNVLLALVVGDLLYCVVLGV